MIFHYPAFLNAKFPGPNPCGPPSKPDHDIPDCVHTEQQTTADTEWLIRSWVSDVK